MLKKFLNLQSYVYVVTISSLAMLSLLILAALYGSKSASSAPVKSLAELNRQVDSQSLVFSLNDQKKEATAKQLGLALDEIKVAKNYPKNILQQSMPLNLASYFRIDQTAFETFLDSINQEAIKKTKQPRPVFDTVSDRFVVAEGSLGIEADQARVMHDIFNRLESGSLSEIKVKLVKVEPKLPKAQAEVAAEQANAYLDKTFIINAPETIFQPSRAEKSTWVTFNETDNQSKYQLGIDHQLVGQYVQHSASTISPEGQVQRVVIGDRLIQEGSFGQQVANTDEVILAAVKAVDSFEDFQAAFTLAAKPPPTLDMRTLPKWIEINLSEQTLAAYEKDKQVFGPEYIASGMSGHETVTGLFHIWLKNYSQTMRGGSKEAGTFYEIPNVQWVSYFFEEYAIHGAWWRSYFGAPGSHGCVNMTNADARWIFDWNDIGTPVLVHY